MPGTGRNLSKPAILPLSPLSIEQPTVILPDGRYFSFNLILKKKLRKKTRRNILSSWRGKGDYWTTWFTWYNDIIFDWLTFPPNIWWLASLTTLWEGLPLKSHEAKSHQTSPLSALKWLTTLIHYGSTPKVGNKRPEWQCFWQPEKNKSVTY